MNSSMLIVEDDEQKREKLHQFISENFPSVRVSLAKSYQSGLASLKERTFDLVVLDMSLPTFDKTKDEDGGRHLAYGGREILRQMARRKMPTSVVIVTQFDKFGEGTAIVTREELDNELSELFPTLYIGMVFYRVAADSWKEQLLRVASTILKGE